ncbi:hypothetical protein WME94_09270 [Sorangium sp. So ce429]
MPRSVGELGRTDPSGHPTRPSGHSTPPPHLSGRPTHRRGRKLAEDLQRRALAAAPEAGASAAATTTRNQLLHLMVERVGAIRKTAAHVFRRHPEIVREVTSAYERRRRAAARREKVRKAAEPGQANGKPAAASAPATPAPATS